MTLSSRTMISSIPMTIFLDREAKHQTTISLSVKVQAFVLHDSTPL
jgi:hypothetical protein